MKHHTEVNKLVRLCDTEGPDKPEKSAKQDMAAITSNLEGKMKKRWESSYPEAFKILDRVLGWEEIHYNLRINLLGWLVTRSED